jgi:hypothetical protein
MSDSGLTFSDVLDNAMAWMMQNVHTSIPGIVEKYDAATCKADISPAIRKRWDGQQIDMPVITGVPVVWPRTSKGAITFPLEKGDGVLLVFSERSIDNWVGKGGKADQTIPRMFDLSDAIAIPGLYSFNQKIDSPNTSDLQIKFGQGKITISSSGAIEISGSGITQGLMTSTYATALESQLGLIVSAFSALGVTLAPFVQPTLAITDKVKAE